MGVELGEAFHRAILAPADDGPASAREADAEQREPRRDQHVERDPDADDAPAERVRDAPRAR